MMDAAIVGNRLAAVLIIAAAVHSPSFAAEPHDWYYHSGPLAGSLKSDRPLPIYDRQEHHLWNRLFAALFTRNSHLPTAPGGKPIQRIEGGDVIDFLGWPRTTYWSSAPTVERLSRLLDEFNDGGGHKLIDDPLKRAVMLRDLWSACDFLTGQNIQRFGLLETRNRRRQLCEKLARAIESLALSRAQIDSLPDNYAAAIASGHFAADHQFDADRNYLPPGLLTQPSQWVEIEFHQPDIHEDLSNRFVTMHTRLYRGRSYFRIFYRFPGGREQLIKYLKRLDRLGVDWRPAAENGFILLKSDAPQIPVGAEFALLQFMITLDKQLRPTPTDVVESVRLRTYASADGSDDVETNTGIGMNVMEYTFKRHLLFDRLNHGGLQREPDLLPQYQVIFRPDDAPDWGRLKRQVLFQQCANCHTTPKGNRTGVHSVPSIVNMGGFGVGAQPGIAVALSTRDGDMRGLRAARYKTRQETYRRLLEYLGR